jgi:predicted nuclease of predicted toxin-antitoxin system
VRILADESFELRLVVFLRSLGHDVAVIGLDHPPSLPDRDVLAIAVRERRVLITNDRDFGELVFNQRLPHAGVILFRFIRDTALKRDQLLAVLQTYAEIRDEFIVVDRTDIRVRQIPS